MDIKAPDTRNTLLWIIALFALAVAVFTFTSFCLIHLPQCFDGRSPDDFPNYYLGGWRLWNNQPVYSDLSHDVQRFFGFAYKAYPADPPFTVFVFSLYSFLPYPLAWGLNISISILLLLIMVWLACRYCRYSIPVFILFFSLALISNPFLFLIKRNHYEVALGLLGLLGWQAFKEKKSWSGSFFWGLAAALKLFPALWFFALPRIVGWPAFWKSVLFLSFFSAVGFVAVGTENSLDYFLYIIPKSKIWYGTAGNYSLISFFYALGALGIGWGVNFFILLSGIFLSFIKKTSFTFQWISLTLLSLLLSPLSWLNYLTIIIPILIILAAYPKPRFHQILLAALIILLLFSPDHIRTGRVWSTVVLSSLPMFGLIGLWIYIFINRSVLATSPNQTQLTNSKIK
jgi:hypothetical protein